MISDHEVKLGTNLPRKATLLSTTAAGAALLVMGASAATAQEAQDADSSLDVDEIVVTATRRASSVQDVPINIAALGGQQIEEQGFEDIADVLAFVPGINAVDRGGRNGNRLIVRGLNADSLGQGSASANGGTVSTYLGDIPFYIDLKLNDIERIETLLGPQGTLYGAGTLGGAIRYIPKRPDFDATSFEVRGDAYLTEHGDGISTDTGVTINVPLSDTFAIRGSVDYLDYKGFIDYAYVVNEPGVSEPDGSDADIRVVEDQNGQEAWSGRIGARWQPTEAIDANLTYYFQNVDNEGRQTSGHRGTLSTGRYESPSRVLEPNETSNELLALEITADLGFAELTSASGMGSYQETGQRDQTDLLIGLEYSYETFPTFTAFTQEDEENDFFVQEVRLVSKGDNDYNWIIGGYYNKFNSTSTSAEWTPGYAAFAGFDRPDDLEYYSTSVIDLTEKAVFGEFGYDITDRWQVTVGARYYEYKLETSSTVDFPLFDPDFTIPDFDTLGDRDPDPDAGQEDDGWLFKFNSSYRVNDDLLVYATVSQGYRIGNSNGLGECEAFDPTKNQGACALAEGQVYNANGDIAQFDERFYSPDKTTNYELGAKTSWLDGALVLNAAVFYVKWSDPQLGSATVNASIPITINATGAESKGVEMSGSWQVTDQFSLRGAFSYTKSELTDLVPSLIRTIPEPTTSNPNPGYAAVFVDGQTGDRLPGSPTTQFSLFANYDQPLSNDAVLRYNASVAYQGHILSRTGARGGGLTLDDYAVANLSVVYDTEDYSVTAYVDNLFDEFAETGVQGTSRSNQTQLGATNRTFQTTILTPRQIGVRFTYRFGQ